MLSFYKSSSNYTAFDTLLTIGVKVRERWAWKLKLPIIFSAP